MKYAFLFLVLSFSYSTPMLAATIKSFNDSQSILTIAEFMIDSAEDMAIQVRISDKKLILKDTSNCTAVTSAEVQNIVESAINSIFKLYPDEELPVEEALSDLIDYLGTTPLKKCDIFQSNDRMKLAGVYIFDSSNQVHVKVDTITLKGLLL
ncbi:MAG: hypothetical protein PHY93_15345 [Bacteriovorax sp.]|nr:hypothetical protein [Bacteriovorax sp.]